MYRCNADPGGRPVAQTTRELQRQADKTRPRHPREFAGGALWITDMINPTVFHSGQLEIGLHYEFQTGLCRPVCGESELIL